MSDIGPEIKQVHTQPEEGRPVQEAGIGRIPESDSHARLDDLQRRVWQVALAVILTACCIIIFYFCVLRFEGLKAALDRITTVLQPFIIGFVLAFLVNPMMKAFEKRFCPFLEDHLRKPEKAPRLARSAASLLAIIIVVGLITLFFGTVLPQLVNAATDFYEHLQERVTGVLDWADMITGYRFTEAIDGARNSDTMAGINQFMDWVLGYLELTQEELMNQVATGVISFGRLIVNGLIGLVVAYYVLVEKEKFLGQTKMILCAVAPASAVNRVLSVSRKANDIFYGFIVGKIIDSAIIGVICYFSCLIMRMPYPVLVSVIIGVTNVIPIFGPYIGAVPTVILIFLTNPMKGIYFLIYVIVLQQIDGNVIGPKILGNSTGVSPFYVIVGIVIGGGLFGLGGMLIGVPTAALLYYLIGRGTRHFLRGKDLPQEHARYLRLDHMDENGQPVIYTEKPPKNADRPKRPPYGKWVSYLQLVGKKLAELFKKLAEVIKQLVEKIRKK